MTIPFLIDFKPYVPNGVLTESIDDMVSINLEQLVDRTDIVYELGYEKNIDISVTVKNITANTQLQITLNFNKTLLESSLPDRFFLLPEETKTLFITLTAEALSNLSTSTDVDFEIIVENVFTGEQVTKKPNVSLLNKTVLEKTISIVN